MKVLPQSQHEWLKAALFSVSAPLVLITVFRLMAYFAYQQLTALTPDWFVADGYLQGIQSEPCTLLWLASAIGTLILSLALLFADRNLAALGFLVFVFSALVFFWVPFIVHE